ncbi:hypothetical protein AA0118_g9681 [Alternaria tenuissima]|nr:hypothetical protein AA0118_g9681 [Alternaria tenuissima]
MRGLLRTAYVRRITVQYLTVLLYDGNADSVGAQGPLRRSRDPNQGSIVSLMRDSGVEVSQEVANEISSSFTKRKFQDALKD